MPLRVLTINLYSGAADPDALRAAIDRLHPDIIAAQELAENAADVLADWGHSVLLDPRDDTTGMGVAARFPAELERIDFPLRRPVRATFDGAVWGLPVVEFLSAHIMNPIARPLAETRRTRRAELQALESILVERPEPGARILVGDFNSSPGWPFYRRIARLAEDGAVAAGTAKRTWSYLPRSPRLLRIDHVFTQGPLRCLGTSLVTIPGDDHRGILAEIGPVVQERDILQP